MADAAIGSNGWLIFLLQLALLLAHACPSHSLLPANPHCQPCPTGISHRPLTSAKHALTYCLYRLVHGGQARRQAGRVHSAVPARPGPAPPCPNCEAPPGAGTLCMLCVCCLCRAGPAGLGLWAVLHVRTHHCSHSDAGGLTPPAPPATLCWALLRFRRARSGRCAPRAGCPPP